MNEMDGIYFFVRVVQSGSFSGAARELRVTPSAISKKIVKLEDRLGVVLLKRSSRKLILTDVGEEFYRTCSQSFLAISRAEEQVAHLSNEARGLVRVALGQGFGRLHVAPIIPDFLRGHPDLGIDLIFGRLSGQPFDDRVDVIVSPSEPPDPNLVVRTLFSFNRVVCAAPSYLAQHGSPATFEELSKCNCLVFVNPASLGGGEWTFQTPTGRRKVNVGGNYRTNNHEALYEAVVSGLGIARMPSYVVGAALRSGELVALDEGELSLTAADPPESMKAYFPRSKNRLKRVSAFVEFLVDRFRTGAPVLLR